MKRFILFIVLTIMMLACEDKPDDGLSIDLLTNGTWIFDDETNTDESITLTFNRDQTYITESFIELPSIIPYMPDRRILATITGDWMFNNGKITFINSKMNIPQSEDFDLSDIDFGVPLGGFYGNGRIFIIDLTNGINDDNFVWDGENSEIKWSLIELTNDKLIADLDGKIIKYYRK